MEPTEEVDRLVEQAHLAIIRHQPDMARSLLQQVLLVDPEHAEARRMLAQIEPAPSPAYSAPNWNGGSRMRGPEQGLPDPDLPYDNSGEADRIYATAIANEAARAQAMRMGINPSPSAFATATPRWMMWLRLAACLIGGVLIMFMPGRHHYSSFAVGFHLPTSTAVLAGLFFGFIVFLSPSGHRRTWWI